MHKASSVCAALAALCAVADALKLQQPRATAAVNLARDGVTPVPTLAPGMHAAMLRRAVTSSIVTAYVAPDNTCGFVSGLPGAGYTCGVGGTCVFYTSSTRNGYVACCNTVACNARAACVDYNQYFTESKCNNGCAVDTFTVKCTNTDRPYCNTISFPNNIFDLFCGSVNISVVQAAQTTYNGQSESRPFLPIALTGTLTATTGLGRPPANSGDSTPSSTGSTASAIQTGDRDNNDDGGDNKDDGSSKTPIGAIVGGVVGGIAAIGLLGLAVFFFLRRKKQPEPEPQQPPLQQQQPPAPMQQNPQYFDPRYSVATSQQPYPSPTQQYPQQSPVGFYPVNNQQMSPNQQYPPTVSHMSDPRMSQALNNSTSPSLSGGYTPPPAAPFHPQQGVIHEAPVPQSGDHNRGQMHELG